MGRASSVTGRSLPPLALRLRSFYLILSAAVDLPLLPGWPCQTSPLQKEVFGKRLSHVTIMVNVTHDLFQGLHDMKLKITEAFGS